MMTLHMTPEPLPSWAVSKATGNYMEAGAQLSTRDGRRIGNAFVLSSSDSIALCVTDIGRAIKLNEKELAELFHPPIYIMNLNCQRAVVRRVEALGHTCECAEIK